MIACPAVQEPATQLIRAWQDYFHNTTDRGRGHFLPPYPQISELLDRFTKFKWRSIDPENVSKEAQRFDLGVTSGVTGQVEVYIFMDESTDEHRRDTKRRVYNELHIGRVHEYFYRATQQCTIRF